MPLSVGSIDSGWENPFRPGGELSKEADQIVRAIQSGRPLDSSLDEADAAVNGTAETIAPEAASAPLNGGPVSEPIVTSAVQTAVAAAPPPATRDADAPRQAQTTTGSAANANAPAAPAGHRNGGSAQTAAAAQSPATVEVQHTLVKPEDASQVEQVTLKKKPRGKCCVVQ